MSRRFSPLAALAPLVALALAAAVPAAPAAESAPLYHATTAIVGYEAAQDAAVARAIAALGGVLVAKEPYASFMLVETQDPEAFVRDIAGAPGVAYAERNPLIFPEHTPNDLGYANQWGMPAIKANLAWDTEKGDGAVVAVLDTGVQYLHADLAASVWVNAGEIPGNQMDDDGNGYKDDVFGWDFSYNDNDPQDCSGHGTHVSGIVAATQDNLLGVTGVAPQAKFMPLSVLCRGNHLAAAALAVAYAAQNGADIVTCSWYATTSSTAFEAAVAKAYAEDNVLFVKSAGNQNGGPVTYPGTLAQFIAVSSLDSNLALSSFSSKGTKVELSAPGRGVYSTYGMGFVTGNQYASLSGTSMAAPHVAGTAALLFAKNPDLTNVEVRAILQQTAVDLGAAGRDTSFGYGIIDAAAAVNAA